MKTFFLILAFIVAQVGSNAQLGDFMNRAKNRAKAKVIKKADDSVDRNVDKTLDNAIGSKKKPTDHAEEKEVSDQPEERISKAPNSAPVTSNRADTTIAGSGLHSFSKFDFMAGDKILAVEDFSETPIGDFPDKWFTNGSGEVVTLNKYPGKWLKIYNTMQTSFIPEFIKTLPDHFTLEYDFIYQMDQTDNRFQHFLTCIITQVNKMDEKIGTQIVGNMGMAFSIAGGASYHYDYKVEQIVGNTYGAVNPTKKPGIFTNAKAGKIFHVSMWRQGPRLRIYLDGDKIFDLPRLFNGEGDLNNIRFYTSINNPEEAYYMSNLRLATGAPDTRNKLITEGNWTTRGISFDVNSDVIKGESYGVLKEISQILIDNGELKIKIIGHTDSDGEDKKNLLLSQKRAAAVKAALIKEFGIEESRIQTDGKGESLPIYNNTTKEGKANNRRVEFIKM